MNSWTAMSATAKTTSIFAALPLNFAARWLVPKMVLNGINSPHQI